jgi:hypothetical protein
MYVIGQNICLWQEIFNRSKVLVAKEVMITINDVTATLLHSNSLHSLSLVRVLGNDAEGKVYEKCWETYAVNAPQYPTGFWSTRSDGERGRKYWIPKEAVRAHRALKLLNKGTGVKLVHVDLGGEVILPKGDIGYCPTHDEYHHAWMTCYSCLAS